MVFSSSAGGFMYRVRWPWASRSMSRTLWPISASAAPRLTAVVVLPTPPFCMATAIVRAKSAPSLTEARRYRPHGAASGGHPTIIGRGVLDPADCSPGRRRLRGGRRQAVHHPPQALPGDLGAGPRHVRGGGRLRDRRPACGLVGRYVQGLLPLWGVAERRLARDRLTLAARAATGWAGSRNRDDGYLVDMYCGRALIAYQPDFAQGAGPAARRDRRFGPAAADHECRRLAAARRRRGLVGVEVCASRRASEPGARPGHTRCRRFHRRRWPQLCTVEGRLRRPAAQ